MRLEPSPHVKRAKSQRSAESRGFSPGTTVDKGGLGKKGPQQLAHAVVVTLP
jgi:hypothetical protein